MPAAGGSPPPPPEALRRSRLLRGALLLLTVLLAAFGVGGFAMVLRFVRLQERTIDAYLRASGEGLARALPPADYLWALPLVTDPATGRLDPDRYDIYADYPIWDSWRETLEGLAGGGRLEAAWLLTPAGDPLVKSDGTEPTDADRALLLQTDAPLLRAAAGGETASDRLRRGETRKRVYVPLKDTDGRVLAVLRLVVDRDYFGAVREQLRRNVLLLLATGLALVVVWWLFLRLAARAIHAEAAAAQADRLRSLGTLTAGIAHEIRNPLGILRLEVEELRAAAEQASDSPLRHASAEAARSLRREIDRLESLTNQFLDMARPDDASQGTTERAPDAVRRIVTLWGKGLAPDRRTLRIEADDGEWAIALSEDRLRQVLLNLLRNAEEALGDRPGVITVSLARPAAGRAVLTVADDGPGMTPAVAAQCLDPFFTTRAEGTGLGLALCRGIVEGAGGRLQVETAPGAGCRVVIELPVAATSPK